MKGISVLFGVLWCHCFVFSQVEVTVYDEDGIGVPNAKVVYSVSKGVPKKMLISDINGKVNMQASAGDKVFFSISFIGYNLIEDTLVSGQKKSYHLTASNNRLGEICVTGEYHPTSTSQSINKIRVIQKEQIINSGASSLSDILAYETNIRLQQDNILGSSLELGGVSGENVKILMDGVPIIGRLNGNVDLSQINLDNVERIEIVNGPLSVNYGTNALAGTINIITKSKTKLGLNGNVFTHYESVGNYNLSGAVNYKMKKHTFKLNGGRKYFDGWHKNEDFISFPKKTLADTNRFLQWKPKLQYFGGIEYSTQFKNWNISPFFRMYYEKITNRGFPTAPYYQSARDDYYFTNRIDQGVNLQRSYKKGQVKSVFGYNYFRRIKHTYIKDLTTLNQVLSNQASDQDTSKFDLIIFRTTYSSAHSGRFNYEVGTDVNVESAYGKKIKDKKQNIGDYALFSSFQLSFMEEKLILKPGLRYAYNTAFTAPLIPSFNFKYNLQNLQMRGSVAKGFRSPTLKELYFEFVDINHNIHGNTNLIPEESWNYNLSFTWLKSIKNRDLVKMDLSLFYNDFSNLITLGLLDDGSYSYINIGDYSTKGIRGGVRYKRKNFNIKLNATYIGRHNQTQDETLPEYIYTPEYSANVKYKILNGKLSLNLFYKYNGKIVQYYLQEDEILTSKTQDYHILDLSVSKKILKDKLQIILGAKNLMNVTNLNVTGVSTSGAHSSTGSYALGKGTSVFLSLRYKFQYQNSKK